MDSRQFEARVETAIQGLPHEFRERLDNVVVVVEDWPSQEQLGSVGLSDPMELLGLYEGLPLTYRSRDHAWGTPDKITIFRRPIQAICGSDEEVEDQIRETVVHEIAHHFGISDAQIKLIEDERQGA
ncbi:MAG: metallopeptidase family protein [Chloroflexi bacterium]|nr:metallopeptidase family protein [Chloroflexota bacterium]